VRRFLSAGVAAVVEHSLRARREPDTGRELREPAEPCPACLTSAAPLPLDAPTVVASRLRWPWGLALLPDGGALVSERHTRRILRITFARGPPRSR
jgi:glucose/arabinose dehydrogenase